MTKSLLTLSILGISTVAFAGGVKLATVPGMAPVTLDLTKIECTAQYRKVLSESKVVEEAAVMKQTFEDEDNVRLEADVQDMGYVVTLKKTSDEVFASVVRAPNYEQGSNSNTTFNQQGRLTLAYVDGQLLGKIVCLKKK